MKAALILRTANSPHQDLRSRLWKIGTVLCLLLLIPIAPFLLLGETFEAQLLELIQTAETQRKLAGLLVLLLAGDIFLPVPSSGVLTFAGAKLGVVSAGLWSTAGMMLGGGIGYELSRMLGPRLLERWTKSDDREIVSGFIERRGMTAIVITRPLPLLAEAMVLLAGCGQMRRIMFYSVMLVCNLMICFGYAVLGAWFGQEKYFLVVLVLSLVVPLLATLGLKRGLGKTTRNRNGEQIPDVDP